MQLADSDTQFSLCERGRSYLLHDAVSETLRLIDLTTHRSKRTFTPRAYPVASRDRCCADWRCAAASGLRIRQVKFYSECDFVVAETSSAAKDKKCFVAFRSSGKVCAVLHACPLTRARAADGHCSATFPHEYVLLCDRGRTYARGYGTHIVDVVTGTLLRETRPACSIDTSGALLWVDTDMTPVVSGVPGGVGQRLSGEWHLRALQFFRYGVCAVSGESRDLCLILRFDGEPPGRSDGIQQFSSRCTIECRAI